MGLAPSMIEHAHNDARDIVRVRTQIANAVVGVCVRVWAAGAPEVGAKCSDREMSVASSRHLTGAIWCK